jgi:UDP-N-acetylmuramoyl-tripeptide--D-alanyl-D-alanine ligase
MAARTSSRVVTFGLAGDVRVEGLKLDGLACPRFTLTSDWGRVDVALGVPGAHMALNAAAAAACGLCLDVPLASVATGLGEAGISPWRMELHHTASGAVVVNDAYNANPASMRAALDTLARLAGDRKIALLGMMAELADPLVEHPAIAAYADELGIELIAVGTDLYGVPSTADPLGSLGRVGPGTAILVKASRAVGLEKLAAQLIAELGSDAV